MEGEEKIFRKQIKMKLNSSSVFIFVLSLVAFLSVSQARIGEYDEAWKKREEEARQAALEAYDPDPMGVNDHLNHNVRKALEGSNNSTRRNLGKHSGSCLATNPIDRCWRCRKDWATNRKRLADCALGFGRRTIGGKNGKFYVVNNAADHDVKNPRRGTLRHAVIQKGPLWIIFSRSMIIELKEELLVTSDKTIDGRGANVHIANGAGITIQFVKNVIIHGLHIHDVVARPGGMIRDSVDHVGYRTASDGDAISIFGSVNVWIDHNSLSHCKDGLIDAIQGSTAITISNNHLTHHNEVMLFGASDSYSQDKLMQITVAFNHFGRGLVQRMPRCRWGFFHVVNNVYSHWLMYAIGGSKNPTIISQGNRYNAPATDASKEVTKREYTPESEWVSWTWRSENDLMMNGARFTQSGNSNFRRSSYYSSQEMITAKPGTFAVRLARFAGALNCYRNKPC